MHEFFKDHFTLIHTAHGLEVPKDVKVFNENQTGCSFDVKYNKEKKERNNTFTKNSLIEKKFNQMADDNNTIDLVAYSKGLEDMYDEFNQI